MITDEIPNPYEEPDNTPMECPDLPDPFDPVPNSPEPEPLETPEPNQE